MAKSIDNGVEEMRKKERQKSITERTSNYQNSIKKFSWDMMGVKNSVKIDLDQFREISNK